MSKLHRHLSWRKKEAIKDFESGKDAFWHRRSLEKMACGSFIEQGYWPVEHMYLYWKFEHGKPKGPDALIVSLEDRTRPQTLATPQWARDILAEEMESSHDAD